MQLAMEPVSLDPALADDDVSTRILANVREGLLAYDSDGKLVPGLASSYRASDGGKRYEFTIRSNARWSDGKPVVAEDFVRGIRRSLDPATGARVASLLKPIREIRAAGSSKLVVELDRPLPYLPHLMTLTQAAPWRNDAPEAATGAYRIVSHAIEGAIRLEPNPLYWNARAGAVPVVLRVVSDEATAVTLFESGDLDVVTRVPPTDVARMRAAGRYFEFPQAATYFLSFNARKPPFNDAAARRAVAGALDRDEIVSLLSVGDLPATSWLPPALEGFEPYAKPTAHAGTLHSKFLAKIVAAYNSSETNALIMQRVQHDLSSRLGLEVELTQLEWKSYIALMRSETPQLYRLQRGAPFLDPIWHLQSFVGDDPNNPTGWKNAEYDKLVARISALAPGKARVALIHRAQAILTGEEAIAVPLFHPVIPHQIAARVHGFRMNAVNQTRFDEITLAPGPAR